MIFFSVRTPHRSQSDLEMYELDVVKRYFEFESGKTPRDLSEQVRNLYEIGENKFLSTCEGSHYIFCEKKILVVFSSDSKCVFDLDSIKNRVRYLVGSTSWKTTRIVFETFLHMVPDLETIHFSLSKNKPNGIILNILEPSVHPNLILKFSEYSDGFSSTYHISSTGVCFVVCDTSRCNSSEKLSRSRATSTLKLIFD